MKVLMSEFPAGTSRGWAWFFALGYLGWCAFKVLVVLGCVVLMIGLGNSNW